MAFLQDHSLQRKITRVMMVTAVTTLLIEVAALLVLEMREFKDSMSREISSVADVIGANSKAALEFEDQKAAALTLDVLRDDKRITAAALYDSSNEIFASYQTSGEALASRTLGLIPEGESNELAVLRPIYHEKNRIGTIYIRATTDEVYLRLRRHAFIAGLILLFSAAAAYVMSIRLRSIISRPILSLAESAKQVSLHNDYSIRAEKVSDDETGVLVDQFNRMLEEIGKKNQALKQLNEALELRVLERTKQLEQSQERLRHSERLASIGTFAAGVAHEIRNPLNAILLASQVALRYKGGLDEGIKPFFSGIADEAKRCAAIIKNVLLFAKEERTERSVQDLNDLARHAVDVAKSYLGSPRVQIVLAPSPEAIQVCANSTELEQVLVNLITNAAEATANPVKIEIATSHNEGRVRLTVADDGPGIPDDIVKHVFDPFFSTKRQRGNTGLGLSLSHGIVTEHGGMMTVESVQGRGTTFVIDLPEAEP